MVQQLLQTSSLPRHTERFFTLRRLEEQAGRSLADAAADVGDALIQIKEELAREGTQTWTEWLAHQAEHARQQGLEPIADRRAREYMALARFRNEAGQQFALFLHIDPACLFPILSLPKEQVETLLEKGVKTSSGATAPLAAATRLEVRAAVADLKGVTPKPATPTRADRIAAIQKQIAALGELSDAERDELLLAVSGEPRSRAESKPAQSIGVADADALARRSQAGATGAAAPVETETAKAAPAPVQAYTGMLGPVTLTNGRLVLGSRERTALANDAIAAIEAAKTKCLMVPGGTGTLAAGRKTTAKAAAEALRLAVLEWPAWR